MKLKVEIHRIARKRKRKKHNHEAKHYKKMFRNNQIFNYFNNFKSCIKEQINVEFPTFKATKERKIFKDSDEVIKFWKDLWEKDDPGRPDERYG